MHPIPSRSGQLIALAIALFLTIAAVPARAADTYTLEDRGASKSALLCVVAVTGSGEFQFQSPDKDAQPTALPVTLEANYQFLDRRIPGTGPNAAAFRAIRNYSRARSTITVGEQTSDRSLRGDRAQIVAWLTRQGIEFYSPSGPLTAMEIELLPSPGDPLKLCGLLPDQPIRIGQDWSPDDWTASALAGVDVAFERKISCKLASVRDEIARVAFDCQVEGGRQGTSVAMDISGRFDFDLAAGQIVSANVTHKETREVGPLSPGMEITLTATLETHPAPSSETISDETVASVVGEPPDRGELAIEYRFDWGVTLTCDRRWRLFHRFDDRLILRILDQGALIAQCNMQRGETVKPGTRTPERTFQRDIRASLGEELERIVSAEEIVGVEDKTIYRVTATGGDSQRPRQWRYYLVTAPDGRQVSFVFTLEPAGAKALGGWDVRLVKAVTFHPAGEKEQSQ